MSIHKLFDSPTPPARVANLSGATNAPNLYGGVATGYWYYPYIDEGWLYYYSESGY